MRVKPPAAEARPPRELQLPWLPRARQRHSCAAGIRGPIGCPASLPDAQPPVWARSYVAAAVLVIVAALAVYPFVFMVLTSVKSNPQFYQNYFGLSVPLHLGNYAQAFDYLWKDAMNTAIVVGTSTVFVLITSCLAGYSFARLRYPGKELLFYAMIALLMVPFLLMLIPLYVLVEHLHFLDTFWGLILPYTALGQVLGISIMRTFFASLPEEMFEACRLDGATEVRVMWEMALPLARPALATVAVLSVISTWNDYLWPLLVLTNPARFTLALGLVGLTGRYSVEYGPLFAGYAFGSIPLLVVLLFANKAFMRGLSRGALRL